MNREPSQVAVVTGASRGVGQGIALALGGTGMTVYISGRGIAVVCDAGASPASCTA